MQSSLIAPEYIVEDLKKFEKVVFLRDGLEN